MADSYTTTASLTSDQAAYERLAYFALRPELYFDQVATVKPTRQSMPGSTVVFVQYADLSVASTALNESTDVDAVALSDSTVTVTLVEQGNAVVTTAKIRGTSFLEIDENAANIVGFNAGVSLDTIARDVLKAGSNVRYATGGATDPTSRATVEANDTVAGPDLVRLRVDLAGANVATIGGSYVGFMHPDVTNDVRIDTGAANWRDPHIYSSPEGIYNGEMGMYEGIRWIETPRAPVFADAGSSTTLTDVYATIAVGQQALAKAWSSSVSGPLPRIILHAATDKLERFPAIGWYWLGGYKIFREACIRRLESASSVGTNS